MRQLYFYYRNYECALLSNLCKSLENSLKGFMCQFNLTLYTLTNYTNLSLIEENSIDMLFNLYIM